MDKKAYHDDSDDQESEKKELDFQRLGLNAAVHTSGANQNQRYVALIELHSAIVKYDTWCDYGTETIAKLIRKAANDPQVAAIVLDIDSGGGSGDAVQNPSEAIREAKKVKPVITWSGNGMMASAAYWIGSQANELYASYATDEVGSIGTYVTIVNYEKAMASYYETDVNTIYATKSKRKNEVYKKAIAGENEYVQKHYLDPFNDQFIAAVREARGEKIKEDVFDGRLVMADEALSYGLIDGIMSFEDVINRAFELADGYTSSANNTGKQSNDMSLFGKKYAALTALIATASAERTDDQLAEANTELAEAGLDNVRLISNVELAMGDTALKNEKSAHQTTAGKLADAVQGFQTIQSAMSSVASKLGLTEKDGKLMNAEGEEISLEAAVDALIAERNEYGKKAGVITVSVSETEVIETEKQEGYSASMKAMNDAFGEN